MKIKLIFLFSAIFFHNSIAGQSNFTISEAHSFQSEILGEERTVNIYLPPSYYFKPKINYPVIYLIDGAYNFHYDTGLIEFMSSVGEKIPEMIVVGISDKGSTKYRDYCSPTLKKGGGNADKFMEYIDDELRPYISKNFRASEYEILIGHSMGGLFVTNYFLEKSSSFDTYIAIDPSLWWEDYIMSERADSILSKKEKLESQLFISVAGTKQMGMFQFVSVLDKYFPMQENWQFYFMENENHGSCHLPTVQKSLEHLFKNWSISDDELLAMSSPQPILEHYMKFSEDFSTSFTIPPFFMGNIVYHFYTEGKLEELEKFESELREKSPQSLDDFHLQMARMHLRKKKTNQAEKLYLEIIERNPMSFDAYQNLSNLYVENEDWDNANNYIEQAIETAKKGNARQWMLNELYSRQQVVLKKG